MLSLQLEVGHGHVQPMNRPVENGSITGRVPQNHEPPVQPMVNHRSCGKNYIYVCVFFNR